MVNDFATSSIATTLPTCVLGPAAEQRQHPLEVPGLEQVRLFAGYSSWAPGQLEAELVDDAWYVVDAEITDIHSADPSGLWWEVVGRQDGALGRLRNYPPEPWHN